MRISFENFKVRQQLGMAETAFSLKFNLDVKKKTRLGKGFRVLKKKEMFKRVFSPIKWVILPLFNDPVVLWLKHFLKDKLPQFRNVARSTPF